MRANGPRRSSRRSPVAVSGCESISARSSRHARLGVEPRQHLLGLEHSARRPAHDEPHAPGACRRARPPASPPRPPWPPSRSSATSPPAGTCHAVDLGRRPPPAGPPRRRASPAGWPGRPAPGEPRWPRRRPRAASRGPGRSPRASGSPGASPWPRGRRLRARSRRWPAPRPPRGCGRRGAPRWTIASCRASSESSPSPPTEERRVVLDGLRIAPLQVELRHDEALELGSELGGSIDTQAV